MTSEEFNEKYKDKGGIAKLNELRALMFTHKYIGDHFGVSKERAKQWIVHLFGESYDPRVIRRERIIDSMIDFANLHSESELIEAFCFANNEWVLQAIAEAHQRGIYTSTQNSEKPHLDNPGVEKQQENNTQTQ